MTANKWESARRRVESLVDDVKQRWREAGERHSSVGLAEAFVRRDQQAFGSVLGSAIALRLFLFEIPVNVALVALVKTVRVGSWLSNHLEESVTTGPIATSLSDISRWHALGTFLSSMVLAVWAARSLARVLSTSSSRAWAMPGAPNTRTSALLAMTAVFFASAVASSVFNSIRDSGGLGLGLAAWTSVLATITVAWFAVLLTLPRGTLDPGALLPGALAFGSGYTLLQWFMQFYLPNKVERTSDTLGQLATTVATLGNFFFVGRLMSMSFVFGAVMYERHGSVSHVIFELPLVRQIPKHSARVRAYFDLEPRTPPEEQIQNR